MLKKVALTRFRGFESLNADLRMISVIMGPNSSGKTSLLHAVRVAVEALAIGLEQGTPQLADDGWITVYNGIVWDYNRLFPASDWSELFTNKIVGEGIEMKIRLTFEDSDAIQDLEAVLTYARNQQLRLQTYVLSRRASDAVKDIVPRSKHRPEALHRALAAGAPKAVLVPAFYGVTRSEEYRTTPHVERMLGGGEQSRAVRNLIARLRPDAFKRLNDFLSRHMGATLTGRTTDQDVERVLNLEVNFQDTNGSLELASAGAGLVNLISLYAAMEHFRPGSQEKDERPVLYLLDEPEAHLHPRLQGNVGETLGALANEFRTQLIIATHSIEMINRLGQRPDAVLLAVDRTKSSVASLDSEDALTQELSRWCDLTPFTSINFLASRRILFHEGPSDSELLKRCADIYFRSRTPDLTRFRQWTLVPLGGTGNVNARAVLGAVLQPTVFPAIANGPPVRAVCVLDRDAERVPGFKKRDDLSRGIYEAHELIWSRYSIESLFLEASTLTAWLSALLPADLISESELRVLVNEAITSANVDLDLIMAAAKRMMIAQIRGNELRPGDALDAAQKEVRTRPEIWQHGRDRAQYILRHVRAALPNDALRNHIRVNLLDLIRAVAVEKLGNPLVLIPGEIRTLLDYMAQA